MNSPRTLVMACATVIEEMLPLMPEGMDHQVFDFGLHVNPAKLRTTLQEAIDAVSGKYDTVILGYGLCSQAIVGIRANGCRLVEAGGDLMGLGEKAPQAPWKIGLQAPRKEMGSMMTTFNVQNRALATSGDYMQAFTLDFTEHHIIDPHCGHSPPELASVSIFAPTAALADGLATAMMVMGPQASNLIENIADCEAYLITKKLDVLKTSGIGGEEPIFQESGEASGQGIKRLPPAGQVVCLASK